MEEVIYLERPVLHEPYLIIGFEGWPNAGEISSFALRHLIDSLGAREFASIPTENFYQMSSLRPMAVIKEGRLIELKSSGNHFYYVKGLPSNDLILFSGVEPHLRWNVFADLILDLAERFRVTQVLTIGGTYDYVPHTYPPMVSSLFNHEELRERVVGAGLGLTEYSGPISIHTFILEAAGKRNLDAISLWGHAPQYLQTRNVKVACSLLKKLIDLTGIEIDLSDLEKAGEYFDQQINQLVEEDPKLQEVIGKLEEAYKGSERILQPLRKEEGAKEDKVVYIQAFLKKSEDEEKKDG
ncbi:MAG TPA: PAC2 family protein [Thermodesulfobacteriota bacterium]|nr:PAC2 family protein [Thermodesulfobacteriota bacterium]